MKMTVSLSVSIKAIHMDSAIFDFTLIHGDSITPMTDALTNKVCDDSFMLGEHLVLRDDSANGIDFDFETSIN